jgi:hypothetical protein
MVHSKEDLLKLAKFVNELSNEPGNEWFRNELVSKLGGSRLTSNDLVMDLRRTKSYLKKIDSNLYKEGFSFYKNIIDDDLRKTLISDYKEMKIALLDSDILEYGRRMCLQLERCFDAAITKFNGWSIVEADPKYNEIAFMAGKYQKRIKVKEGFKKNDYTDPTKRIPKEIGEIEFNTKVAFCGIYFNFDFQTKWSNIQDIYFLRNKASHGSLSMNDFSRLEKIKSKFDELNLYYLKMFKEFISKMKV